MIIQLPSSRARVQNQLSRLHLGFRLHLCRLRLGEVPDITAPPPTLDQASAPDSRVTAEQRVSVTKAEHERPRGPEAEPARPGPVRLGPRVPVSCHLSCALIVPCQALSAWGIRHCSRIFVYLLLTWL